MVWYSAYLGHVYEVSKECREEGANAASSYHFLPRYVPFLFINSLSGIELL